jgi:hypothetical protein
MNAQVAHLCETLFNPSYMVFLFMVVKRKCVNPRRRTLLSGDQSFGISDS